MVFKNLDLEELRIQIASEQEKVIFTEMLRRDQLQSKDVSEMLQLLGYAEDHIKEAKGLVDEALDPTKSNLLSHEKKEALRTEANRQLEIVDDYYRRAKTIEAGLEAGLGLGQG